MSETTTLTPPELQRLSKLADTSTGDTMLRIPRRDTSFGQTSPEMETTQKPIHLIAWTDTCRPTG